MRFTPTVMEIGIAWGLRLIEMREFHFSKKLSPSSRDIGREGQANYSMPKENRKV